jgi:hypothetical protein
LFRNGLILACGVRKRRLEGGRVPAFLLGYIEVTMQQSNDTSPWNYSTS